jgi:putative transposase
MITSDPYDKIEAGKYYHVYNRAVGSERLFFKNDNYAFFLKQYHRYLSAHLTTHAYCLMPNHFHLAVRINDPLPNAELIIGEQFRRFFIGYSQSINRQESRKGNLFIRRFRRKRITDDEHLATIINYIHRNPVHHKLCSHPSMHVWNSYHYLVLNKPQP